MQRAYERGIRQRPSRAALPQQPRRPRISRRRARRCAASSMRASDAEIIFTRNATEAINLVASSYGGTHIGEGDEIVLSIMEHHSNIVPWHFLKERQGAVLKWAPISDDGELLLDEFEALLTPAHQDRRHHPYVERARHRRAASRRSCGMAHARGIPVLVDGAQGAVHLPVDVQDLDCDFYAFTGHKLYGPTGIGVLYGKKELLEAMPPYQGGGEMIGTVTTRPHHLCRRRRTASRQARRRSCRRSGLARRSTMSRASAASASWPHEDALLAYAMERLGELNWLRIFGRRQGQGLDHLLQDGGRPSARCRARSSTVTAWPSGPAPIAPSRFWRATASPRLRAPHSPCIIRSKRSTGWSRRCIKPVKCSLEANDAND